MYVAYVTLLRDGKVFNKKSTIQFMNIPKQVGEVCLINEYECEN